MRKIRLPKAVSLPRGKRFNRLMLIEKKLGQVRQGELWDYPAIRWEGVWSCQMAPGRQITVHLARIYERVQKGRMRYLLAESVVWPRKAGRRERKVLVAFFGRMGVNAISPEVQKMCGVRIKPNSGEVAEFELTKPTKVSARPLLSA